MDDHDRTEEDLHTEPERPEAEVAGAATPGQVDDDWAVWAGVHGPVRPSAAPAPEAPTGPQGPEPAHNGVHNGVHNGRFRPGRARTQRHFQGLRRPRAATSWARVTTTGTRGRPGAPVPSEEADVGSGPVRTPPEGTDHRGLAGLRVPGERHWGSTTVRVVTGTGVGILALVLFEVGPVASLVLVTVFVAVAAMELHVVLRRAGYRPATLVGVAAVVAAMVAGFLGGQGALTLVAAATVLVVLVWYLVGAEATRSLANLGASLLAFAWVGFLGAYAGLLLRPAYFPHRHGVALVVGAIATTVVYDIAALVAGSRWGRHLVAPSVSPHKTWEGLAGGSLACLVVSVFVVGRIHPWDVLTALALGVVVCVMAPLGDLCESMVKRGLQTKDMGSLLPGHGGVLDRVDAMLFVLPATFYLARVLNLG